MSLGGGVGEEGVEGVWVFRPTISKDILELGRVYSSPLGEWQMRAMGLEGMMAEGGGA